MYSSHLCEPQIQQTDYLILIITAQTSHYGAGVVTVNKDGENTDVCKLS